MSNENKMREAFEEVARQWDGCMYDAVGETTDIGACIRAAGERLSAQAAQQPAHIYMGRCPDDDDMTARDPDCPACQQMQPARGITVERMQKWAEALGPFAELLVQVSNRDLGTGANVNCQVGVNHIRGAHEAISDLRAAIAEQAEPSQDAAMLDWLDETNRPFRMGWKVGAAPAGNVSVQAVIQIGDGPLTSIREAIRSAMAAEGDKRG